jgi:hypothetical protein
MEKSLGSKLDILSADFDPLLALGYQEESLQRHVIHYKQAPIYDNISQWHKAMVYGSNPTATTTQGPTKRQLKNSSYLAHKEKKLRMAQIFQERYEKANAAFKASCMNRFYQRLDKLYNHKGPLSLLYDVYKCKGWVKVTLVHHPGPSDSLHPKPLFSSQMDFRNQQREILDSYLAQLKPIDDRISEAILIDPNAISNNPYERGFIIGQLLCFDKHMNLVIGNALEGITNRSCLKNILPLLHKRSRRKSSRPKKSEPYDKKVYWRTWPTIFLMGSQIIHVGSISK